MHFDGKELIESKGFNKTSLLNKDESIVLRQLMQKKPFNEIIESNHEINENKAKKIIMELANKGFIKKETSGGKIQYKLDKEIDLPFSPRHKIISSINSCGFTETTISNIQKEKYSAEEINSMIKGLWTNAIVKKTERILRPVYYISLEENGRERTLKIDGMTGQII